MSELRDLCALVDAADARMSTAGQVASQDDVALAQREYHEASAKMDARVKEIGLALHERGGEDAMREVLVRLEREYGKTEASGDVEYLWRGIGSWTGDALDS